MFQDDFVGLLFSLFFFLLQTFFSDSTRYFSQLIKQTK